MPPKKKLSTRQTLASEHMENVLSTMGFDMTDEHVKDTPARFIKYLSEYCQQYQQIRGILGKGFKSNTDQLIVQTRIPFRAVCAHHLLPFMGTASIGYIPKGRVVGLSKIARLIKAIGTTEPGIQEDMTNRIAEIFQQGINPAGLIVIVTAMHTCMGARGIAVPMVNTTTSAVKGLLKDNAAARQEFFELTKLNQGH